ncbi:MAG: ATP-dependent DNA helicase RecG [Alphaproteobacteria bacterium]|nr:ATP-dependent DNA helicase RecG [Alphaproteobacteria bacterium]
MSRPFDLDPLFRALTTLPGVGPKNAKYLEKLIGGPKVLDLLWHLPVDFIDRRFSPKISEAPNGRIATMEVTVDKHMPNARKSLPYRVSCSDETGAITLVFFRAHKDWIEKQLPLHQKVIISGKVEYYQGRAQMAHPDAIGLPQDRAAIETVEPVYPLTQGITNKAVRKAMQSALGYLSALPEWLDEAHKKRGQWPDWYKALEAVHSPESESLLSPEHPARMRMAYDELLANQLTLALVRDRARKINGRAFQTEGVLREKILSALPFDLTSAQKEALGDIDKDMSQPARMLRLLQGDVGSGKTVVACLAMMSAVQSGAQAALMAPTEILARQHADNLKPWLEAAGVRAIVMTGRDKGKTRETMLQQIRSGAAQVVIGTHAIFQEGVDFNDLGLAVIDEQHRFGVHQRLALSSKSKGSDVLVMTATPIPRTLALTAYGDMEVSKIGEKPPGRQPIDTRLTPIEKIEDLVAGLKRQIQTGARVYWVCPLVEESEKLDLAAAEERYDILKAAFGERVGLIHGRMKPLEKDAVMEKFAGGDLDILVATTVIEVGVDVPEATIMVIEHAERFGLSQLHQLRGRVGRGSDKSYCFLLYTGPLGETAKERLSVMRDTEDGFVIAEKDLSLRGSGDILGVRQSGSAEFKLANLAVHGDLLAAARADAKLIIEKDSELESPRGQALKTLLYLFEQDQGIKNLRSG